jgi:hypothetical protein
MADNPPALEQYHCDARSNFVRIDRPKQKCTSDFKPSNDTVADQSSDLCGDVCAVGRQTVAGGPQSKGNHLKMTKLKEEFFKILPPTIFFFVALHLVMFVRILMLEGTGVSPYSSISIAIAALIFGKSVLIADMLPFINRFPHKPLIYNIAWKTVIYLLISLVIHYLERLVDFWRQAGGFVAGNQKLLAEIVWPHFWAIQIILFMLVAMYCTMHELVRVIGKEKVLRIFFGPMPIPQA